MKGNKLTKMIAKISGQIIRGAVLATLLLSALVTLGSAFNFPKGSPNSSFGSGGSLTVNRAKQTTTLSFADRVAYQRAIEDVYWRHRIWPKENRNPKPSLDTVMSQAQLEKKVEEYLRISQTLEDYRQRATTAEELQAEMDRMAKDTKQSDVLRELFEAL